MGVIYGLMINDQKILFISFFLYFIIFRNSIRTLRKKITVSMATRKFHLIAVKKRIFKLLFVYSMSENADWIHKNLHEEVVPHPSL